MLIAFHQVNLNVHQYRKQALCDHFIFHFLVLEYLPLKLLQYLEDPHFQMHINVKYLVQNDADPNLISIKIMMKCFDLMKFYDHFLQLNFIMIHLFVDILFRVFHIDLMIMIVFQLNYKVCALSYFKGAQLGNFYQTLLLNFNILLNQSFL